MNDVSPSNISIYDNSDNYFSLQLRSDGAARNTRWTDSGLEVGDQLIIEAGGETLTLTFSSAILSNLTSTDQIYITYIPEELDLPFIKFSSAASTFDDNVISGGDVSVKLKKQNGKESSGIVIVTE